MPNSLKRLCLILLTILVVGNSCRKEVQVESIPCSGTFQDSNSVHPKNSELQSLLNGYIQKGLPGISVHVTDPNGTWVGSAGWADVQNQIPYQPCHVQKVASLTKWFMSTLVLKLMEDSLSSGIGYNDLDKPIGTWIPKDMLKNISNSELITLRQCMNHSTGLYDLIRDSDFYLEVLNDPTKKWKQSELLQYVRNKDSEFEPGTRNSYSNTNTLMVSLVLDYATGVPHHTLLRNVILNPLGLENTIYHHHEDIPAQSAQGYFDLYQNKTPINVSNYVTGSGNGYTGIYSNVFDLQRFMKAVLVDQTFLSSKSLEYMQTVGETDDEDVSLGLGIMKRFQKRGVNFGWGHTGRDLGFAADLFYFPNKQVSIAWCINYGADADSYLRQTILNFQEDLINLMQE